MSEMKKRKLISIRKIKNYLFKSKLLFERLESLAFFGIAR